MQPNSPEVTADISSDFVNSKPKEQKTCIDPTEPVTMVDIMSRVSSKLRKSFVTHMPQQTRSAIWIQGSRNLTLSGGSDGVMCAIA